MELAKQGTTDILLKQLEFFGSKAASVAASVEQQKKAASKTSGEAFLEGESTSTKLVEAKFGETCDEVDNGLQHLGPDYDNFEDEDTFAEEK